MLSLNCFCLFVPICIAVAYGHLLRRALLTKFVLHITTVLECFLNYPDHVVLVTCLYIIQCCLLVNSEYNVRVNSSHNYLVTSVAGVTYESSHLRKHWRDILYTNLPRV